MENVTITLDEEVARLARVRALLAWQPVVVNAAVTEGAWLAQDRYALSWWDVLIIAAARTAECRYPLSEDLQDGQVLDGLYVLSPFRQSPSALA